MTYTWYAYGVPYRERCVHAMGNVLAAAERLQEKKQAHIQRVLAAQIEQERAASAEELERKGITPRSDRGDPDGSVYARLMELSDAVDQDGQVLPEGQSPGKSAGRPSSSARVEVKMPGDLQTLSQADEKKLTEALLQTLGIPRKLVERVEYRSGSIVVVFVGGDEAKRYAARAEAVFKQPGLVAVPFKGQELPAKLLPAPSASAPSLGIRNSCAGCWIMQSLEAEVPSEHFVLYQSPIDVLQGVNVGGDEFHLEGNVATTHLTRDGEEQFALHIKQTFPEGEVSSWDGKLLPGGNTITGTWKSQTSVGTDGGNFIARRTAPPLELQLDFEAPTATQVCGTPVGYVICPWIATVCQG